MWTLQCSKLALATALQVGPGDGYALSNDAAYRGDTAVVGGDDPSSAWYNPAAIAKTQRLRASASLSVYGLRLTRARSAFSARAGDEYEETAGRANELGVVPAAFGIAGYLPRARTSVGFTVHTPVYSDAEFQLRLTRQIESGAYGITQQVDGLSLRRRYHAGPVIGWQITPQFSLGLAASAIYDSQRDDVRIYADARGNTGSTSVTLVGDELAAVRVAALDVALGVRGQLSRRIFAGASLRSPGAVLWKQAIGGDVVTVQSTDDQGQTEVASDSVEVTSREVPRWLTPWNVQVGLALALRRTWLELNAGARTGVAAGETHWRRAATWNVQFGFSHQLTRLFGIGGGVFTDRTDAVLADSFPGVRVHRYGGSIAGRFRQVVYLHKRERANQLVFQTTVALRYSAGIGQVRSIDLRYPADGPSAILLDPARSTPATQHLLGIYIGSGFEF